MKLAALPPAVVSLRIETSGHCDSYEVNNPKGEQGRDIAFFNNNLERLAVQYGPKFLVIRHEEVIGAFDEPHDAINDGVRRFRGQWFVYGQARPGISMSMGVPHNYILPGPPLEYFLCDPANGTSRAVSKEEFMARQAVEKMALATPRQRKKKR